MGLGPPMLVLYKYMRDQGMFDEVKFVAEIGSQEYDTKLAEFDPFLERFFAEAGADTPTTIDPENGRYKGPCNEFYKRLGAVPLDEWTRYRLTGDPLRALGQEPA